MNDSGETFSKKAFEDMKNTYDRRTLAFITLLLVIITLAAFWRVFYCDFLNYDDNYYVTENRWVKEGITLGSVKWAFTTGYQSNWHPLTWISHMVDYQLFGLSSAWYHAVNLLLHLASVLVLFAILVKTTRLPWRSAFVAAFFAIHPLHVESVAWVAERKDVLSGLFWMLTVWAYVRYVERPDTRRYLQVILFLALGLMSKPVLVTLPFALLLLDYWPLARLFACMDGSHTRCVAWSKAIVEKIPLFILVLLSSVVTYIVQQRGHAMSSSAILPFATRLENAFVSYLRYMYKAACPHSLAIFYPYPKDGLPAWLAVLSVFVLLVLTVLAFRLSSWKRYVRVGWLWFLGTLVPMLGIVQVGAQAMADRYAYIPLIGLFIIVAWGVPDMLTPIKRKGSDWRIAQVALPAAACLILVILGWRTWVQVGYWKNSETVFQHALKVTRDNYIAHNNLGLVLAEKGKVKEAYEHFNLAIQAEPGFTGSYLNLGVLLAEQGLDNEAATVLSQALALEPENADILANLGAVLARQGKVAEARIVLRKALELAPDLTVARENLEALSKIDQSTTSRKDTDPAAYVRAGMALDQQGDHEGAIQKYRKAISLDPKLAEAYSNMGVAFQNLREFSRAAEAYKRAIQLKPNLVEAHNNLAVCLYLMGDYMGAWKEVHMCRKYGLEPNPR
ncbi:MAG: tetratricopeptide repeat protein, partial [Armatimonadota bacterium]